VTRTQDISIVSTRCCRIRRVEDQSETPATCIRLRRILVRVVLRCCNLRFDAGVEAPGTSAKDSMLAWIAAISRCSIDPA
jgi:hypothetical protein